MSRDFEPNRATPTRTAAISTATTTTMRLRSTIPPARSFRREPTTATLPAHELHRGRARALPGVQAGAGGDLARGRAEGLAFRRADRDERRRLGRSRGARRRPGRRRHDPRRQPDRMGADDARVLADGRRGAAVQHAAAQTRPGAAGRRGGAGAMRRRRRASCRAARWRADASTRGVRGDPRRGPPAGDAGLRGRPGTRGSGPGGLHLGYHRRAARGAARDAISDRAARPGGALARRAKG